MNRAYRGRFAPTPSGPLHFGSLVCALAGWLQARTQGGEWLLRIDDLDGPRVERDSVSEIPRQLEAHGLEWDGSILYQSSRYPQYLELLESLKEKGLAYPCHCSRKEIALDAKEGPEGLIYPGTCSITPSQSRPFRMWRMKALGQVEWRDLGLGLQKIKLESQLGDFPLWRADGIASYHLATVMDEKLDRITEIVRGEDLLFSSARHLYLQQLLGHSLPRYLHLPLAKNLEGKKLSKKTQAPAMQLSQAGANLQGAMKFLGLEPPLELATSTPNLLLPWAIDHWSPKT